MGVFLICWLGLMADGYDLYVYGATLPGFIGREPWNVTPATAGAVGSLALLGMLPGSLVAGTLTDRLGRRRLFIGALTLFSLAMLVCAFAPNFAVFAGLRFVACAAVGGLLPTAVARTNEFADVRRESIVLGPVLTGPAIGTLLAATAALDLVESSGVRPVYALGAVSAIFFLLIHSIGALVGTVVAAVVVQRTAPKVMVVTGFVSAASALLVASQASSPAVLGAVTAFMLPQHSPDQRHEHPAVAVPQEVPAR